MKVLLVGINAKFIHSNLAIRSLQKYAKKDGYHVDIAEYTINQNIDHILAEIIKQEPKVIGFSCYLWNIEYVIKLCKALKKVLPSTFVILGGPEVSYNGVEWMENEKTLDAIICGEGEETFKGFLDYYIKGTVYQGDLKGIIYRKENEIIANLPSNSLSLDTIPFVYYEGMADFDNRIIYYESQRGCPFNCQYCISSIEKGVRFRNLEIVKKELQFFLDYKVMQVKFVDRTFNCNKGHAIAIWEYLNENDNGTTNFHFEISADLLDETIIKFLHTVRPGLFQFEIGVQSTHEQTLMAIDRKTDFKQLVNNVLNLKAAENIHLHLDLIVGLPYEDYLSFSKSFNDVYSLKPEQLQIGFLKVLKGSGIYHQSKEYKIEYRDYAPYEVLSTKDISFNEINQLKMLEEMVETFYNSGHYMNTVLYLEKFFETPFDFYTSLARFWEEKGFHKISHSKISTATNIKDFGLEIKDIDPLFLYNIIKYDWCLLEKVKKYPEWIEIHDDYRAEINNFYKKDNNISHYLPQIKDYSSKQISRMAHIEVFDYDMTRFQLSNGKEIDRTTTILLFNYFDRDPMRHNPRIYKLNFN